MRNLETLTANQILSLGSPESLFSRAPLDAKQEYRSLAMRWHPDHSKTPDTNLVFQHILDLYRKAQVKQSDGSWVEPYQKVEEETPGLKKFLTRESATVKTVEYLSARKFELGTMYISDHTVSFDLDAEFTDLFHNGRKKIRQLRFKNESMAVEMSKFLPQIEDIFQTKSGNVISLRKTPDQLLLADVLKYYSNRIEPIEHIGWIVNVLLNITCYLNWSGLSHNAISADTFFISPLRHSGMLLGGWWYATAIGERLKVLPDRTLNKIPGDILLAKQADSRIDLELVKALGREILGAKDGSMLDEDNDLPQSLNMWLHAPSNESAIDEYKTWKYEVLKECFGAPHFVAMKLDKNDLYKEI